MTTVEFCWLGLQSCRAAKSKHRSESLSLPPLPQQGSFSLTGIGPPHTFFPVQAVQVIGGAGSNLEGQNQKLQTEGTYWQPSRLQKGWRVRARDKIILSMTSHRRTRVSSAPPTLKKGKHSQVPQVPGETQPVPDSENCPKPSLFRHHTGPSSAINLLHELGHHSLALECP